MIKSITLIGILSFTNVVAFAGTMIEIQDGDELTTVMTDGKQARMNVSAGEYVIVNYQKNTVKYVSDKDRQILLIDTEKMPSSGSTAAPVKTSIDALGSGGSVAGYATEKFTFKANGKSCGTVYGSKQALKLKGIQELFNAMKTMAEKQRAMMGGYAGMIDDCTRAEMEVSDHVKTVGVPMRTEKDGRVLSQIKSIKTNVSLPADAFVAPADYKTVTMQEKMKEMSDKMTDVKKQMQKHQPQMQEMMKQMQQSGQMTPEMMDRMRQAEEMMKRYQQP